MQPWEEIQPFIHVLFTEVVNDLLIDDGLGILFISYSVYNVILKTNLKLKILSSNDRRCIFVYSVQYKVIHNKKNNKLGCVWQPLITKTPCM